MDLKSIVFSLLIFAGLMFQEANAESLETMNVAMPTNYGTFFGEIHYAQKDQVIALKVERIIKEDLIKVINYFEYVPHDVVHFNLDPYMRVTNGNARGFPTNIINLYNFPANNSEHLIVLENWMQGLVLHEFVHIVHLDQTRDYLSLGRQIFGTIAKVPVAIVPRWFTEGIAVWGESHLIAGGRLNNPLFNKELYLQFKNHDFCKTIDCLDDPGIYPHGQLAYWAGSHFIDYLENKKPKTIKCLVEENSQALPFFLNNAFEKCVGEKAQDLYLKFRQDYITNFESNSSSNWGEDIKNEFGADNFQKGYALEGERLFKVESQKKSEALVSYDLEAGVHFKGQFDAPISDVVSMVDVDNENKLLLVSFNDDPNYRATNKTWKLVNPDTLLVERTLGFAHDPSYVISMGGENYLTFSYWKNEWIAEYNGEVLHSFSSNDNLVLVKKIGDRLLLKINDSYGVSSLLLSDLKLQKMNVVFKSSNAFSLPVIGKTFCVIKEADEFKLLDWEKNIELSKLPKEILSGITFLDFSKERIIALEKSFKSKDAREIDIEKILRQNKTNTMPVEVNELKEVKAPTSSYLSEHAEHYPRLDHLIPHYWFLAAGSSENLGSIGATTTFVDPMEVHSLNATAFLYPTPKKVGGLLNYVHKIIPASDLWIFNAIIDQDYSKTNFSNKINLTRDLIAQTYYKVLLKKWTYNPAFFIGKSTTEDFLSDRTLTKVGMGHTLEYLALSYDDFFQYFTGTINLQANKANLGDAYPATLLKEDLGVRFNDQFSLSLKSSLEKLFKSDFIRGVSYGGGLSDFTKIRSHEFYGVPYSDAYGNMIATSRLTGDFEAWDFYRGKNLIPFFFKELHMLAGLETLYADRIILDGKILREKTINGIFAGPRLKMDFAYFVPVNIDLIFSKIYNPDGKNVRQANLLVMANILSY